MENKTNQKLSLQGQRVIVMGGSSGIGLATAIAAAAEGASVTIVSGNQKRIDNALASLPGQQGHAVDLGHEVNIKNFFAKVGSFDHLVYTAGENLSLSELADTDLATAKQFWNLRYWGAFAAVKYGAAHINAGGSIVLTGGIAASRPGKGWSVATSICAAMEGFTRAMAVELAPIRVNIVVPGVVRTNLWGNMGEAEREEFFTNAGNSLLVKRVGEADDIAQTYLYLMKQKYSTGQSVTVDGGGVLV
jgi:NAD(P)-dependent dehydrogenase (short-subunit alcohol dehydrogenase family)